MGQLSAGFRIKKPFGAPVTRNYSMNVLTVDQLDALARNLDVVRVDVDTASTQPRTQAVFPAWRYGNSDDLGLLEGWHCRPVPDEESAIADVSILLQGELAELQAKASPDADDLARMTELQDMMTELADRRFWSQADNAFGDGRAAVYRACSAPNIPFKVRSNWVLDRDRPFTVFLHRARPHEDQADCWVRFRFGHWGLILSQEKEVRLVRYRDGQYWRQDPNQPDNPNAGSWETAYGSDFDKTAASEQAIAAVRDGGRMTAGDRAQVGGWKQEIRDKQAEAKKNKALWTDDQKAAADAYIAERKAWTKSLQDSKKGLNAGEQAIAKGLEEALYAEEVAVQWTRMAESTFGVDIAITIIPQPRGYLTLHCSVGRDYFVYEDKEVTASGADGVIVSPTPVEVDGNGGAVWFSCAYIQPVRYCEMVSQPLHPGGTNTVSGSAVLSYDATLPQGTGITAQVTPRASGRYTWTVGMTSEQGYLPFLYRLWFNVLAVPRDRSAEVTVFDIGAAGGIAWEVGGSKDEENRGRAATLTLTVDAAARGQWEAAVRGWENHQVQVWENGNWFSGALDGGSYENLGYALRAEFRGYDLWTVLKRDRMWGDLIGDGMLLGDYVTGIVQGAGFWPDEVVVSGPAVTMRLPTAFPGQEPLLRPEWGGSRGEWLLKLLGDFGYFMDMWFDGDGRFHFEPLGLTTRPYNYTPQTKFAGDREVMFADWRTEVDNSDVVNYILVLGKTVRGKPLQAFWADYASVHDPTSSGYVGRWIADQPYHNDALNTQALVNLACRWRAYQRGRRRVTYEFSTYYNDQVSVGDRFLVNGQNAEVLTVSADSRSADRMRLKVRCL